MNRSTFLKTLAGLVLAPAATVKLLTAKPEVSWEPGEEERSLKRYLDALPEAEGARVVSFDPASPSGDFNAWCIQVPNRLGGKSVQCYGTGDVVYMQTAEPVLAGQLVYIDTNLKVRPVATRGEITGHFGKSLQSVDWVGALVRVQVS